MDLVIILFALLLAVACIVYELYFIYALIISKNCKYPPAFPSFGNMKKITLAEARKVLSSAKKPLKIIDLGCGTGTLLLPLSKEFPEHKFVGYDWDWFVVKIISFRSRKLKNVTIVRDNFMNADFKEYDLLLCFLDTKAADDLSLDLKGKLKKTAVVISSAFELKDMTPTEIIDAKSYGMPLKVYIYGKKII